MNIVLVVAALVGLAKARPETGYSYPAPLALSGNIRPSIPVQQRASNVQQGTFRVQQGASRISPPSSNYGVPSQTPLIHKHIYVHVAPPEPEVRQQQVVGQQAAPQKHYKVVFIKAPSAPAPAAPTIQALAQNQEKTLIYILVKRPEDAPQINIPTAAPTQPSKPEVYFIRYKTRQEATSTGARDSGYNYDRPSATTTGEGVGYKYNRPSRSTLYKGEHGISSTNEIRTRIKRGIRSGEVSVVVLPVPPSGPPIPGGSLTTEEDPGYNYNRPSRSIYHKNEGGNGVTSTGDVSLGIASGNRMETRVKRGRGSREFSFAILPVHSSGPLIPYSSG